MKICHLSSVHSNNDIRIFVKECVSLAAAGHEVYCIANGEDREVFGVHVIGLKPASASRIYRMLFSTQILFRKALQLDCDLYHLHDPELLLCGLKLKKRGKIVVFDSHEDVPAQILDKMWLPRGARKFLSLIYRCIETFAIKRIDAVVAATPYIAEQFAGRAKKVVDINNFPKLDDIVLGTEPFEKREPIVCYAGGISENRGEEIMKNAVKGIDAELIIAGKCDQQKIGYKQSNVVYTGQLNRKEVNDLYNRAVAGLCLLKPTANYINSQPIKIYEYMAAGLPFICSDFPLWKDLVNVTGAGICVRYDDLNSIRDAISKLLKNRKLASDMGKKGYKAIVDKYSWEYEAKKLVSLYDELLGI